MAFTFNMPSKAELAEKMAARTTASGGNNQQGPREASPFWPYKKNMKADTTALLRFLPDSDRDNPNLFYAHRKTIRLRFEGATGGDGATTAEVSVTVPSMEMWADTGEKCPIAQYMRAQKWWDSTPEKKEMALKYYRRHEYVTAGFVVQSPFEESPAPENPIRKFILPKKGVGLLIEASVSDTEMEDLVIHETGGREFKLKRTKNGDWPDYTQSSWSMRARALTDDEIAAIEKFGLVDLRKTAWERKPDNDEKDAILAMFHDSLNGNPFDIASFGKWYRHYEDRRNNDTPESDAGAAVAARANTLVQGARVETPASTPAPVASAPAAAPAAAPAEASTDAAPGAAKVSAADILARIKARQAS